MLPEPHLDQAQRFAAQHANLSQCDLQVNWQGAKLLKICKQMATKAAGPDAWSAAQLALLPLPWLSCFAQLWEVVYNTANIPARWLEARVALLPKGALGFRPLSILNVAWRIGAKYVNRALRSWILRWASHECVGGVPGGSVPAARIRLARGLFSGNIVLIGQDLRKFFDSIAVPHLAIVLEQRGAPRPLISLVESFFTGNRRWRALAHCQPWVQGCPLSPTLAAAIMSLWCKQTSSDNVRCVAYIDDRCMWGEDPAALLLATHRSNIFDNSFGFQCAAAKCQLAFHTVSVGGAMLLEHLHYSAGRNFGHLGSTEQL